MFNKICYLISVSLVVASSPSFAASKTSGSIDLNSAINEALGTSPVIEMSTSAAREGQWKKKETLSEFLPHIYANGNHLFNKKYQYININFGGSPVVIPQIIPNSQFNLLAELPLFNGLASTYKYLAAKNNAKASKRISDWTTFSTEMAITEAFYETLAAQILEDVSKQNVKVLAEHERQAKLFKKNGLSTNYDLLRVEVESSNAKTELADRQDDIIIAKEKLAYLMGNREELRHLKGKLPIPSPSIVNQAARKLKQQRADLEALELQSKAQEYQQMAASRFWVPEFSFFAAFTEYNNLTTGFTDWNRYRNARQIGIRMQWNLFDGLKSFSESKQSIERKIQASAKLREKQLRAHRDTSALRRRYLSQCRIYRARKEDVIKSKESVRLAREGKKVGSRTDTDLLDAEIVLHRSRAAVVTAQLEAARALIKLQLAEGYRYSTL